jgi:hypothetical protein
MIPGGVAREQLGEGVLVNLAEDHKNGVRWRSGSGVLSLDELEAGAGQGPLQTFGPGRCITDQHNLGTGEVRRRLLVHAWQRGEWTG